MNQLRAMGNPTAGPFDGCISLAELAVASTIAMDARGKTKTRALAEADREGSCNG